VSKRPRESLATTGLGDLGESVVHDVLRVFAAGTALLIVSTIGAAAGSTCAIDDSKRLLNEPQHLAAQPSSTAPASTTTRLKTTVQEALAAAYRNNPTLQAERAGLRGVDEGVPQALSNWRPDAEVTGDVARSATFTSTRTERDQIRTPRGVELSLTQPLFRGFRTVAATREAESQVRAARARLTATEQEVLLDAVRAYMDVVSDLAVLELNTSNEQVLARQLKATRERFRVGELTRTDVKQAEARLTGATTDRIQAEGDLEASRATYRKVIGETPENLIKPQRAFMGKAPPDKAVALKLANDDNPGVIAAIYDERVARHNVDEVRGELLPSLELSATLSRDMESTGNKSRADEKSIMMTLTMPLYQSGAVHSRLREAKQAVGRGRFLTDQARLDAVEEATHAWEALGTAQARIISFSSQVKANEIALDGVRREAEVGARTVLDILNAEQELVDTEVKRVQAQRDEVVALFELKAAMGQLTARHLGLPVAYCDPARHYEEVRDRWLGTRIRGEVDDAGSSPENWSLPLPATWSLTPPPKN
jgi:outer membrane protein